jgi:hypothetical protein
MANYELLSDVSVPSLFDPQSPFVLANGIAECHTTEPIAPPNIREAAWAQNQDNDDEEKHKLSWTNLSHT